MKETYLNEYHRKHSEGLRKEIEEMMEHPYTYEQALEQVEQIHRESVKRRRKSE